MTEEVSLNELLEAGCHFGHQARRWNPRMKPYLYAKRDGLHVFDLVKTKEGLESAMKYLSEASKEGKRIVFIATKRQAQDIVKEAAMRAGVGYVTERWLGGMLTNYDQMRRSMTRMKKMKTQKEQGQLKQYTKKEQLLIERDIVKMEKNLGGMAVYESQPEVLVVVDTRREKVAVDEARSINIPVVGIVDSNADPSMVDYVIPANDDAVKSVFLLVNKLADAIIAGKNKVEEKKEVVDKEKKDSKVKKEK